MPVPYKSRKIYRILDANLNRCREGLRVCEDVARFALDAKALSSQLKKSRHAVSAAWKRLFEADRELLASRDSSRDVGRGPSKLEAARRGFWDLYWANSQRAKEALRSLEESVKLIDARQSAAFKRIRFRVYTLEKRALPKLEALRDQLAGVRPRRKGKTSRARRRGRHPASR